MYYNNLLSTIVSDSTQLQILNKSLSIHQLQTNGTQANNQTSDNDNNDDFDITELLKFCYKTIHNIVWCDAQNAMYM